MPYPQRVRCSPLGREERIADVVDVELRATRELIYSVEVNGHRYGVLADDAEPVDED